MRLDSDDFKLILECVVTLVYDKLTILDFISLRSKEYYYKAVQIQRGDLKIKTCIPVPYSKEVRWLCCSVLTLHYSSTICGLAVLFLFS